MQMNEIEVVIKIPQKVYEDCIMIPSDIKDWKDEISKAFKNGTVLPKGHGRLIDADKIIYYRCPIDCSQSNDFTCQHCNFGIATKFRTDGIPTIIEADIESEDEKVKNEKVKNDNGIIHCKDCKYRDYWGDCTKWSKELDAHKSYILDENMFCGFAEKKHLKEVENDT